MNHMPAKKDIAYGVVGQVKGGGVASEVLKIDVEARRGLRNVTSHRWLLGWRSAEGRKIREGGTLFPSIE